ncbi:MAG TPA: methionyl-tRNA formyltransferase, partial [Usitatibacter sp.]|nr:methionyl-tRNA formyltransferase [Usitatibacter sp.]
MRVAFAGTPVFAARALEALLAAHHEVGLVLTQPDRPAGRGLRFAASAVGQLAQSRGLTVLKSASLEEEPVARALREAGAEVLVVAAYGLILPRAMLEIPARGCLNIHASLLPRWRGAAPIQRALLAGDARTGISIMRMEPGLDTGPVLLARELPIGPRDTAGSLTTALAALGAEAIIAALEHLDELRSVDQDDARATYAPKISKGEARIDWRGTSAFIDRQIRAFDPAPGAETRRGGDVLKIWQAEPLPGAGAPGEVIEARAERLVVACGEGALRLTH